MSQHFHIHINEDERQALIMAITCEECKNFAWSSTQMPITSVYETPHHPACKFGQLRRRK